MPKNVAVDECMPNDSHTRGFDLGVSHPRQRSVRLVAAVVFVLLGVACVSSVPVAADGPTVDGVTIEDNESWIGIEDDHTVAVEAIDIDTTDGPATVTVDLSGWSAAAIGDDPDVEIQTDGVEIVGEVETEGTETTFEVDDDSMTEIDLEADIEFTLEHPTESSFDGATYAIDVEVTDSIGTAETGTELPIKRLSYDVDGEERFPPSTEFVFRNQTATVTNLDPDTAYTLYEFDPDDGSLGEPIEAVGSTEGSGTIDTGAEPLDAGWYIVYGDDIATVEANAFRVQPHRLEATPADGEVDAVGGGAETNVTLESPLRTTAFDVNVTSTELDAEELFEVFDGAANPAVERIDGSETTIRITGVESGGSIPVTFDSVSAATYEFEFEATDTNGRDSSSIAVKERDVGAEFGSDVFEAEAGAIVEADISLEDTEEAYVMIGGDRESDDTVLENYFDILHVEGDTTVRINTRLLGTNVPSEEVYAAEGGSVTSYVHAPDAEAFDDVTFEGDADDIGEFRSDVGVGDLPRPLQPGRYRLVAGIGGSVVVRDDGVPEFERPVARSNLLITDTDGFGSVTTYVAPEGSANDVDDLRATDKGLTTELTERSAVAKGDRLVFEIEAEGMTGVVSWLDDRLGSDGPGIDPPMLSKLLEFPDGFRIDGEQTNPGQNEAAAVLDIGGSTDGELYLVPAPTNGTHGSQSFDRYYLVLDTRGTGPFDREPVPGDEYRFRFGYNSTGKADWFGTVDHDAVDPSGAAPHFPYVDADAGNDTETRFVTIEEPTAEYDRVDDRQRPIVRSSENGTITGRTNLAPGTDVAIQLVAETRTQSARATIEDVEIGTDGAFNVTHDLSVLESGATVETEFYADQRLVDKRAAVVIGEDEPLVNYEISEYNETVAITAGSGLENLSVAVENRGYVADEQSVELSIDGESFGDRTVGLDGNASTTFDFGDSTAALAPGEYPYTVSTDDDEVSGRLLVDGDRDGEGDEENDTDEVEGEPSTEPTETPADPTEDESDEPSGPLGMIPAPPVGARSAIGGAAIVGAVHVLGHWT
ncbi:MAG: BGTF surface domain-containing protein [Halobacteriota archaeon]|uniref:BGTF surface domain-containing protein n=1 Tax=Natronomonas sp. TaxID=2184060 RepID=UPI003975D7E0